MSNELTNAITQLWEEMLELNHIPVKEESRRWLRYLEQPDALTVLLQLPIEVALRMPRSMSANAHKALYMAMAIALDIALHVPLDIKAMAELDLASTILSPVPGDAARWRIAIPADNVRNTASTSAELGILTSSLLSQYVRVYRPVLATDSSTRLLLRPTGEAIEAAALAKDLALFIQREIGLIVHPDLVEHLPPLLYLTATAGPDLRTGTIKTA